MNLNEEEFLDKDTEPRTYNLKPSAQCQLPTMLNQVEYLMWLRRDPEKFKVLKGFFG